jgi:hypothetical protein
MFRDDPTPVSPYAPDLMADRAMRTVSRAFPALSVVSLALPFGLGWAIGGDLRAALIALLWAGLVRVALLQHVTWSVNSLCHLLGSRPFTTRRFDRATNLWPLALLSFGESWHNMHHSDPTCARHGVDRHQINPPQPLSRYSSALAGQPTYAGPLRPGSTITAGSSRWIGETRFWPRPDADVRMAATARTVTLDPLQPARTEPPRQPTAARPPRCRGRVLARSLSLLAVAVIFGLAFPASCHRARRGTPSRR